jgi:hypothetical protein
MRSTRAPTTAGWRFTKAIWRSSAATPLTPRASPEEVVTTEVESTPLRERTSDDVHARILADARGVLRQFQTISGRVDLPIAGHLVVAKKAQAAVTRP